MGNGPKGEDLNIPTVQRSEHRILTTHTGSLPRPAALTHQHVRSSRGEAVDQAAIDQAGRDATVAALGKQIDSGIDVVNNGEQSRSSFVLYLRDRLTGLGSVGDRAPSADIEAYPQFKRDHQARMAGKEAVSVRLGVPKAIGAVDYVGEQQVRRECAEFSAALTLFQGRYAESFMTAPSPGIVAAIVRNEHYDSFPRYMAALGAALKHEYDAIVQAGFVLQLDCPDLALERHTSYRDRPIGEFVEFVELVVATINEALKDIARERVRMHVCWGNYEAPHDHDVALDEILPTLLKAKVGGLVLPFANPRHAHDFKILDKMRLADDQVIVAGVIDSLTNFVEHPEVVADRLERVAAVVGDPRRVLAGTDCGFDTSAGQGRVSEDVVWAKLRALADGAKLASERLFKN
jgi:5-methyltetrahydropteroyltriglutamate--homocysteine methyltransferase